MLFMEFGPFHELVINCRFFIPFVSFEDNGILVIIPQSIPLVRIVLSAGCSKDIINFPNACCMDCPDISSATLLPFSKCCAMLRTTFVRNVCHLSRTCSRNLRSIPGVQVFIHHGWQRGYRTYGERISAQIKTTKGNSQ